MPHSKWVAHLVSFRPTVAAGRVDSLLIGDVVVASHADLFTLRKNSVLEAVIMTQTGSGKSS